MSVLVCVEICECVSTIEGKNQRTPTHTPHTNIHKANPFYVKNTSTVCWNKIEELKIIINFLKKYLKKTVWDTQQDIEI